jgi:hypothetical protein
VIILKVLVSYPDGRASLADIKRDVAVLANQRAGVVGTHHHWRPARPVWKSSRKAWSSG